MSLNNNCLNRFPITGGRVHTSAGKRDLGSGIEKQPTIRHASGSPLYRWSFASVAVFLDQEARWLYEKGVINMSTKYRAKMNKLGEMINNLLMKVVDNKELYGDVLQLREKHDAICSLVKKDKTISLKQGKYFMALAFKKDFKEKK